MKYVGRMMTPRVMSIREMDRVWSKIARHKTKPDLIATSFAAHQALRRAWQNALVDPGPRGAPQANPGIRR